MNYIHRIVKYLKFSRKEENKEILLFRPQRYTLMEAMEEVAEVKSLSDVQRILGTKKSLDCEYYGEDERIGWNTWIITYTTGGVVGFSNGKLI